MFRQPINNEQKVIVKISSQNATVDYLNENCKTNTDFNVKLLSPVENIIGVRLLHYSIPFDWYIIHSNNNAIRWETYFKKCDQKYTKKYCTYLPNGTYNINTLSDILTTYMTNEEINIYLISDWINSSKSGLIKITRNNELSLNNWPIFDVLFTKNKELHIENYSPNHFNNKVATDSEIIITFNNNIFLTDSFKKYLTFDKGIYSQDTLDDCHYIKMFYNNIHEVPITFYIKDNSLYITPYFTLHYCGRYKIIISNNTIKDTNDFIFSGLENYSFNTNRNNCLHIKRFSPTQNSTIVHIDSSIEITFNKNIEFTNNIEKKLVVIDGNRFQYTYTDTSNKIQLISEFGTIVPIIMEIIQNKLVIKPEYTLDYNTKYSLKINYGAIKIYGSIPSNFCNINNLPGYVCGGYELPGYVCDGYELPGYVCGGYELPGYRNEYFVLKENEYCFHTVECPMDTDIYSYRLEKLVNNTITEEVFNKFTKDGPGFLFWFNIHWDGWNNSFKDLFETNVVVNTEFLATGRYTLFDTCCNNGFLYYNGKHFVKDMCVEPYGLWKYQTDTFLYIFWWNSSNEIWQIGRTFKDNKIDEQDLLQCKNIDQLDISKVYPKHKTDWIMPFNTPFKKWCIIDSKHENPVKIRSPPKITDSPWALLIDEHSTLNNSESGLKKSFKTFSNKIITETYFLNPIPNNKGELETSKIIFKGLNNIEYEGVTYTKQNMNEVYPIKYTNKYDKNVNRLMIEAKWNNILEKSYETSVYPPYFKIDKMLMHNEMLEALGLIQTNLIKVNYIISYSGKDISIFNGIQVDYFERTMEQKIKYHLSQYAQSIQIKVQMYTLLKQLTITSVHNDSFNLQIKKLLYIIGTLDDFKNMDIQFKPIEGEYTITDYNPDEAYVKMYIGDKAPNPFRGNILNLDVSFLSSYEDYNPNRQSFSNVVNHANNIGIPIHINCDYRDIITNHTSSPIYYFKEPKSIQTIYVKLKYPNNTEPIIGNGTNDSHFQFEFIQKSQEIRKTSVELLNELKLQIAQTPIQNNTINLNDIYGV